MRFDSISALLQLLLTFNYLGYMSPSVDFDDLLKKNGMTMHISRYTCKVTSDIATNTIKLSFYYYNSLIYSFVLNKVYDPK